MNTEYTRKVVEASMLAAGRSLSLAEIAQLFDPVDRPDNDQLRSVLGEISESLDGRGVELLETAQGFRVQVRREVAENVSRLWPERPPRYSRALLETLSIIAYRQPLTRAEIENIRGVQVNPNIIKTLAERNWIRVVGHREVPGRPELLGTTRDFLDYFGLKALEQLPPLAELKSLEELDPQLALPELAAADAEAASGEGEGELPALPAPGEDATIDAEAIAEPDVPAESDAAADAEVPAEADAPAEAEASAEPAPSETQGT
jgi:segregation and condensation protein B